MKYPWVRNTFRAEFTKLSHLVPVFLVTRINTDLFYFFTDLVTCTRIYTYICTWYTLGSLGLPSAVGTVCHSLIHRSTRLHVNSMSARIYLVIVNIPAILTRSPRFNFTLNKNIYFHEFWIFWKIPHLTLLQVKCMETESLPPRWFANPLCCFCTK